MPRGEQTCYYRPMPQRYADGPILVVAVDSQGGKDRCLRRWQASGVACDYGRGSSQIFRALLAWSISQAAANGRAEPGAGRPSWVANKGVLAVGADADFIVLNSAGEVIGLYRRVECSHSEGRSDG